MKNRILLVLSMMTLVIISSATYGEELLSDVVAELDLVSTEQNIDTNLVDSDTSAESTNKEDNTDDLTLGDLLDETTTEDSEDESILKNTSTTNEENTTSEEDNQKEESSSIANLEDEAALFATEELAEDDIATEEVVAEEGFIVYIATDVPSNDYDLTLLDKLTPEQQSVFNKLSK